MRNAHRISILVALLTGSAALAVIAYSATREGPVDRYSSSRPAHFLQGVYVGAQAKQVTSDKRNKVTAFLAGRLEYAFPAGTFDAGFQCDRALNLAYVPGAAVGDACLLSTDRGPDLPGAGAGTNAAAYSARCFVSDAGVVTVEKCSTDVAAVGDAGYRVFVISNQ